MPKKGDTVRVLAMAWTEYQLEPFTMPNDKGELIEVTPDEAGIEIVYEPPKRRYKNRRKKLYRAPLKEPRLGVLIGKTRRQTGYYDEGTHGAWDDYDPPSLVVDKTHIVWLIEPEPDSVWYREPFTALEDDLEVIE